MKVIIIGAGLAGLSTAYHLEKSIDCEIYERNLYVGGYASSYQIDDYIFDFSGHYLHLRNNDIKNLIFKLLKGNVKNVIRSSVIFSHNKITNYPYQSNFYGLPEEIIIQNLIGFIKAKYEKNNKPVHNFYDWILKNFGKGIAENFMVPYNEKLWGVHPKKMSAEWIDRFIPDIKLNDVIRGTITKKKNEVGYNSSFLYPIKGGIGSLSEAFAKNLKNSINLGSTVCKVNFDEKSIKIKETNEKVHYDLLINTSPLKSFVLDILENPTNDIRNFSEKLKSNKILVINLGLNEEKINHSWIYFPENKYLFFRIGNYSKASEYMSPKGSCSVYIETNISKYDKNKYDQIVKKNLDDLISIGFLTSKSKIEIISNKILENAYSIPLINNKKYLESIKDYLKKKQIITIGRYGKWEYSSMEDAILNGKKVAEEVNSKFIS